MATITELNAQIKRAKFAEAIGKDQFDPKQTMQVLTRNFMVFGSWGVTQRINYNNKALMLHVNARYHKGKVWIVMGWDDTYTVHIATNQHRIIKTYEMVYFDMLVNIIDGYIETRH